MAMGHKLKISVLFFLIHTVMAFGYHDLGYQYLYPKPGAPRVPREAHLIIRLDNVAAGKVKNLDELVHLSDQNGRRCSGTCKLASDKNTILFIPDRVFVPGDHMTVRLAPETRDAVIKPITYRFKVSPSKALPVEKVRQPADPRAAFQADEKSARMKKANGTNPPHVTEAMIMPNGVSVPSNFPHIDITINDNPDDGYIFIDNRGGRGVPWNVIFDNTGCPVWYRQVPDERRDFKVQPNGWATMIIRGGYGEFGGSGQGFLALDKNYQPVKTFYATNGYYTDEHELQVLEDGGYLLIGRRNEKVDMSEYVSGGQENATVLETCIQEYTADDELVFQWAAWDHLDIRDIELSDIKSNRMYFSHMNSIDIDTDSHIIVSNRELSEVTKIHRQTGEIIWRLGGAHNQFTYIDDPLQGTRNQHAARVLGDNIYSIFDNGNGHNPRLSRAVKYQLDTEKMTATLIWEFRDEPDKYSHYMGNAQPLPNGNMLINWAVGHLPKLTEVRPNGEKAFEMNFVNEYECYRVHRCDWDGMSEVPQLIVEQYPNNLTLIFNKFGDPDVDYYRIYADKRRRPTTVLDTSHVTLKKITSLENGQYWIRVTAVYKDGRESGYSNEEAVLVNFREPGGNLVNNGDFSGGKEQWSWELQGTGDADWSIKDGEAHIAVTSGGGSASDIQLYQNGIPLMNGGYYVFEFDARADGSRIIEAKVGQDRSPYINYSKSTFYSLTSKERHFTWEFVMEEPSDFNARVAFNMGKSDGDVYLDNISLRRQSVQWAFHEPAGRIPGILQCEEYDYGGEGFAYHDDTDKDGDAGYRPEDNVDVQATTDDGGGYNVGWTEDGEWLEYTVNAEPGSYDIEFRAASDPGGGVMRVLLDDHFLARFNIAETGGWQSWTTLTKSNIEIDGGENLVLRLEIIEGSFNLNWINFVKPDNDVDSEADVAETYELFQNYPNPFNPETRIEYRLPEQRFVRIEVLDLRGRRVCTLVNRQQRPGLHHVMWDGKDDNGPVQASGIYFLSIKAGNFHAVKKMTLLK